MNSETIRLAQRHKERMDRAKGVYGLAASDKLAQDAPGGSDEEE